MGDQFRSSPNNLMDGLETFTFEEPSSRAQWKSKVEFLLCCMGYAIGLGNVWRFPFLCYRNGGGAFLVPYLIMLFLCGIPLFFMETCLGQFTSLSCTVLFSKLTPLLKGVGYAILVVNLLWIPYFNIIISYPLYFLAMSFRSKLPWEDCNNTWNTENCLVISNNAVDERNISSWSHAVSLNTSIHSKTPADEFFHEHILQISDGIENPGGIVWNVFICNCITWICIFLCIMNGVKSIGKVVYITAIFPFLVLFALFIRGITLPGASDGILFYISPKWDHLSNLKVWVDGASQIFYSLGPGWGGLINMASYNKFKNNCKRDCLIVPILNSATSIFAGFVVFSVIGFMSHETGISVTDVATGGPSLVFVTYPEAISMLPLPQLWSVMFFAMLFVLGIGTELMQVELLVSCILDEYPSLRNKRKCIALGCCFIMFLISISCVTNGGMYVIQLLDWFSTPLPVLLICMLETIMVAWIYGHENFVRDVEFLINEKLSWWWPFCWKIVSPIVLMAILISTLLTDNSSVSYKGIVFPTWAIVVGWLSAAASVIIIPIYAAYKLFQSKGSLQTRFRTSLSVDESWGPAKPENRNQWKLYCSEYTSKVKRVPVWFFKKDRTLG